MYRCPILAATNMPASITARTLVSQRPHPRWTSPCVPRPTFGVMSMLLLAGWAGCLGLHFNSLDNKKRRHSAVVSIMMDHAFRRRNRHALVEVRYMPSFIRSFGSEIPQSPERNIAVPVVPPFCPTISTGANCFTTIAERAVLRAPYGGLPGCCADASAKANVFHWSMMSRR